MSRRTLLLVFALFVCLLTGCKKPVIEHKHKYIGIINNSDLELLADYSLSTKNSFYSTLLICCNCHLNLPDRVEDQYIAPHSEKKKGIIESSYDSYEIIFEKNEKISLLLIDCAKIPYVDLDKGAELKSICFRYDVCLDDLEELGWTVTFPPTEEMRGITMDPDIDTILQMY